MLSCYLLHTLFLGGLGFLGNQCHDWSGRTLRNAFRNDQQTFLQYTVEQEWIPSLFVRQSMRISFPYRSCSHTTGRGQ
jgi:hypothetical protein